MEKAITQIRTAQKEIKSILKQAKEKCDESNCQLAAIHALTCNVTEEKALKSIISAEQMSTVWKKILHTHKKNHHGSITSLRIPESWPHIGEDINTVKTLENPQKANELHFGQAQGTPFTVPPVSIEVDWAANSITSEIFLDEHYTNKGLGVLRAKLIEHCKKEHNSIKLGKKKSVHEWKEKVRTWNEKMTTSPSGCHLGHLQALQSQGPNIPISDEEKEL
eukprot:2128579-Ditylum_brightwellii.AAC.1